MGVIVKWRRGLHVPARAGSPIAVLVGLLTWEVVGRSFNPLLLAPPTVVAGAWVALVESGELPAAAAASVLALALGFGAAMIVGLAIGTSMALSKPVRYLLDLYVNTFMAAPMIALLPIIVLFFGLEMEGRAAVVFLFAVFTVIVNTEAEVSSVKPEYLEMARSFGLTRTQMLLDIRLPSAAPGILIGTRVALVRAMSGMIVAELFLALTGIGYLIKFYGTSFQMPQLYALILTVTVVAVLASSILNAFASRSSHWQRGMRWEADTE